MLQRRSIESLFEDLMLFLMMMMKRMKMKIRQRCMI